MQTIILEGIATSGKTSVKKELVEALTNKGISFWVVEEDVTLMPILENTDKQVSINLLKAVISKVLKLKKDVLIFDRLFFTHIFRTTSSIEDFREIENMIKEQAFLAFLKVDESNIPERITYACEHREESWNTYVSKKGSNEEIYQYYINQQRLLLDLLKATSLKCGVYNTTDMEFKSTAEEILDGVGLNVT